LLNIIAPVFDLGRSFRKLVLKKSVNLYSKLRGNPGHQAALGLYRWPGRNTYSRFKNYYLY